MINVLDALLRDFFIAGIEQIRDESQVGFDPPDQAWRTFVGSLSVGGSPANALNIYLVDLVENRKLRNNARARGVSDGVMAGSVFSGEPPPPGWVVDEPCPSRLDCHYLVSAWSPSLATPATAPTLDEHALLYEAMAALERGAPIAASRIYPPGSAVLAAVPALIREEELPTDVAHESFAKLAEFWGTMGTNFRWKPAIHVVVTLPVQREATTSGPMVTTRITEYRVSGRPESAETWIQVGGHVLDATAAPSRPIENAWVRIERAGERPQTARTNALGRFTFGQLRRGEYTLSARATGFAGSPARTLDVPSPSGEYDLEFT